MNTRKLKVLMIVEQCNPEWASVPLVGYNFYHGIRRLADVTLVTHERNRAALEKIRDNHRIDYIRESRGIRRYYGMVARLTSRGGVNWPLQHALSYPVYAGFNRSVHDRYRRDVQAGRYDIVHALTPMLPRYPVKLVRACGKTPFLLGPVNGGVPFPPGFQTVARKEFAHFNFLRIFTRMIPGYAATYKKADRVLSGSAYTLEMLQKLFAIRDGRIELFHENGIRKNFIGTPKKISGDILNMVFVGRLVAYKGADMAIEAVSRLDEKNRKKVRLTIVGDGSERENLVRLTRDLGLQDIVHFTGWVSQEETLSYYNAADVFCFPSIREFGGAVALEAMACGLPCLVPDHAGLGEYVTEKTGFKIRPASREYLVAGLTGKISLLIENRHLIEEMSVHAIARVKEYEWNEKARRMVGIYRDLLKRQL